MRTEDGNIIQECLNGKPQAFGMLVDKYKEGIYAFVYAELGDFQDAQDVTQEVFLQAYRDLRSLRRWESFVFWLYCIARRQCVQWFRARSRRVDREFIEDQDSTVVDAGSLDSYRDSQLGQSLREAMDSLPELHRDVLMLHYFAGMNSREIAGAIGISPGAVRMRLSRARAQLREEMIDMMHIAFEDQRIPAGFTLRIVESVRHIKANPVPRMAGLPWGLSVTMGIIITVLSLNPHLSIPSDMTNPAYTTTPIDTKVLKTGRIPVDILDISQMPVPGSEQSDNGREDNSFASENQENTRLLAPQAEGGTWTEMADMPTRRWGMGTGIVNGKVYVIGGADVDRNPVPLNTVEEYDPATDTWTSKADMPTARRRFAIAVCNGKIYAFGGMPSAKVSLSTVEEYDPATDTWAKKADMPVPLASLATGVVNGKIYIIGGADRAKNPTVYLATIHEYDPMTDTWTQKADMKTARGDFATAVYNGKIYAFGGWTRVNGIGRDLDVVEEYDPIVDRWVSKKNMPAVNLVFAAVVANEKIYTIGGLEPRPAPDVVIPTVYAYDPAKDTWTESTPMPTARSGISAAEINGRIYVFGGWGGGEFGLSTVEQYTPEEWSSAVSPQGKLPDTWSGAKSRGFSAVQIESR